MADNDGHTDIDIQPSGQACGAVIRGVDLAVPLDDAQVEAIRKAWLEHHVLVFPDQVLTDADLERYTRYFGEFGDDPFFAPIEGHDHIAAICRRADETSPVFAEAWHTDWSFQAVPPAGTCLYGITIPPVGGNTGFANQHLALAEMPDALRARIDGKVALHSAVVAYSPEGTYGDREADSDRSMAIRPSEAAREVHRHPLIRAHPETGEEALFSCFGYIIGIEGMADEEARELLLEIYHWQTQPAFQYDHQWQAGMLVMWDNRSVLHKASGGYDGYDRLLHRTTIAGKERYP